MSDEHNPPQGERDETVPSVDEIARLDAFLDALIDDRKPASSDLHAAEVTDRLLAAQLRLARDGVEEPAPEFLAGLERAVTQAVAQETRRRRMPRMPRVSRGGFLRTAAALAGGAGLGLAAAEGVSVEQELQRPRDLVAAGNERWYDIAAEGEVSPGGAKPFSAGGVLGFLLNDEGHLHAVSAICTHMGCRLKPDSASDQGRPGMHCLCHGSRFNRRGEVVAGLAPSPLPAIAVQVHNGRVYALGTRETV